MITRSPDRYEKRPDRKILTKSTPINMRFCLRRYCRISPLVNLVHIIHHHNSVIAYHRIGISTEKYQKFENNRKNAKRHQPKMADKNINKKATSRKKTSISILAAADQDQVLWLMKFMSALRALIENNTDHQKRTLQRTRTRGNKAARNHHILNQRLGRQQRENYRWRQVPKITRSTNKLRRHVDIGNCRQARYVHHQGVRSHLCITATLRYIKHWFLTSISIAYRRLQPRHIGKATKQCSETVVNCDRNLEENRHPTPL